MGTGALEGRQRLLRLGQAGGRKSRLRWHCWRKGKSCVCVLPQAPLRVALCLCRSSFQAGGGAHRRHRLGPRHRAGAGGPASPCVSLVGVTEGATALRNLRC